MSRIAPLSWIALVACCLLAWQEAAAQPITHVYRADTRTPTEIFIRGFQGRGNNMDLLAHTLGEACEETNLARASTWVSMSSRRDVAIGFSMGHLETLPGTGPRAGMWIYTIRADQTYVDVQGILRQAAAFGRAGQYGYTASQAATLEGLLESTVIGGEYEVVAHYVAPWNIVGAQLVFFDAEENFIEGGYIANPGYQALETYATDFMPNLQRYVPASSIREDDVSDSDSEGSCSMTCDGASVAASSRSLVAQVRPAQCRVRSVLTPLLLDVILD